MIYRFDAEVAELVSRQPGKLSEDEASLLAGKLGGLARWLLNRETRERARPVWEDEGLPHQWLLQTPTLEPALGACAVLLALEDPTRYPALEPAFVLPLCWRRGDQEPASSMLPHGLAALEQQVLGAIEGLSLSGADGGLGAWRLGVDVDGDSPAAYDLSGMPCKEAHSAWASLAAGLWLASRGGVADSSIVASACWKGAGLGAVAHLEVKAEAAHRHGAHTLFVAGNQHVSGDRLAGCCIECLPADTR